VDPVREAVRVPVDGAVLDADVAVPGQAERVVVFAHGSGSSRHSPRNRYVAQVLQQAGVVTVLADLLDPREEAEDSRTGELRFDIALLGARVVALADWAVGDARTAGLPLGLFGASTGAAAALVAAAERSDHVHAVVSRGGRPDLAAGSLPEVVQPTLLVVGGRDGHVLELNRRAARTMTSEVRLEVVPGATHLFEEPGALERVSDLARDWFTRHLDRPPG